MHGLEIFSLYGAPVANLTAMRTAILASFLLAMPAYAQQWSASFGSGPFIFGHFAERSAAIGNEGGTTTTRSRLSAATRAGASADIERDFGRWFGVRLEAAWTRAPLSVKSSGSSLAYDAGRLSVTTFVVPLVVHLTHGAFQFHVMAGPAYALYDVHRRAAGGVTTPLFEGRRGRLGGAAGVGVAWWWNRQIAAEWQAADIVTGSPFHVADISPTPKGVRILRPQNGHTTIGIRYRF